MSDNIDNKAPSLSAAIRRAFINMQKDLHTVIPGKVVSFNAAKQTAEIQPLIKRVFVNKEKGGGETERVVSIPKLINVPVMFPRSGGWSITFPVKAGDECLVHFSERSIDAWHKNGGEQTPTDWRMHDYSDAICQLGLSSAVNVIDSFNVDDMEIRNDEGDVKIALKNDKQIELTSPIKVLLSTPEVETTDNLTVGNDLTVGGDADISGESTASDHISDTVSGKTHTHIGSPSAATGPVTPTGVPN